MKRVLLSLVCCLPLLFSPSISFSLEPADENVGQTVSYERYGPISDVETLWSISTKLRPDSSVSIQQTLVAIYKLNHFAFYNGNINKIIPESILNVPTLGFTQAQTNQEAVALISKYSALKQLPIIAQKQQAEISEETLISTETKPVTAEVSELIPENLVDKEELITLENELETLRNEYDYVNQQLSTTTQNNESLKLKLQPLNDQLVALSEQLQREILVNEKLQNIVNDYSAQLDKIAERPFYGDGLLNKVLRFITSSLTTLLFVITFPALMLLTIIVALPRLRSKREGDEPESELTESETSELNGTGQLDSVLTKDMPRIELINDAKYLSVAEQTENVHFNNVDNDEPNFVEPATENEVQISGSTTFAEKACTSSPAYADLSGESAVWESHSAAADDEEKQNDSDSLAEAILAAEKTEPGDAAFKFGDQDFVETEVINAQNADFLALPEEDENLSLQLDNLSRKVKPDDRLIQVNDFIDIETLMGDADLDVKDEPYSELDLDLGLDEFPDVINLDDTIDIDDDLNGIGAQLDLARAYLEIDDKAGAKKILLSLAEHSNGAQRIEIDSLLSRLA